MRIAQDELVSAAMTAEQRLDALAEVLAEGFLYLAENGLLESDDSEAAVANQIPSELALTSEGIEGSPSFKGVDGGDGESTKAGRRH